MNRLEPIPQYTAPMMTMAGPWPEPYAEGSLTLGTLKFNWTWERKTELELMEGGNWRHVPVKRRVSNKKLLLVGLFVTAYAARFGSVK